MQFVYAALLRTGKVIYKTLHDRQSFINFKYFIEPHQILLISSQKLKKYQYNRQNIDNEKFDSYYNSLKNTFQKSNKIRKETKHEQGKRI